MQWSLDELCIHELCICTLYVNVLYTLEEAIFSCELRLACKQHYTKDVLYLRWNERHLSAKFGTL